MDNFIKEFNRLAKYYYQWRRCKKLSLDGLLRGLFEYYCTPPFLFASVRSRDISLTKPRLKRRYKKHWNRPVWKHIREHRFYLDDYKCVYCGSTVDLQCHHLNYDSLDTEREVIDCRTTCYNCHQILHGITPKPKRNRTKRNIFK